MGFQEGNIVSTLERYMKCGVGKCGHCCIGVAYVCGDGPVFTYEPNSRNSAKDSDARPARTTPAMLPGRVCLMALGTWDYGDDGFGVAPGGSAVEFRNAVLRHQCRDNPGAIH